MTKVLHLNCGLIESPLGKAACHCLAIENNGNVVLIDTGIGLADCHAPERRLGQELINQAGFRFVESMTALCQLETLGLHSDQITDIVLTHADPDHVGGLADFPNATIHLSSEEFDAISGGSPRYCRAQFDHQPKFRTYSRSTTSWRDFSARRVDVVGGLNLYMLELFGHTLGHCGVVLDVPNEGWLLHTGDAYYLRAELDDPNHPVGALAELRAEDNNKRLASLQVVRDIRTKLGEQLTFTGYHDLNEYESFVHRKQ